MMASSSTTEATRTQSPASSPPARATQVALAKLEFIEEMTTHVDAVQERVLAEILGRNGESEYHARCGLAGATDRATFRAKVPMVTYEDLKPFIMRVAGGDRSPVLSGSAHPISEFFSSSGGTSAGGQLKLIPSVEDEFDRRQLLYSLIMPVMSQFVPGVDKGKGLYFLFVRPETKTASGLPARPVLTSYYKSEHFRRHGSESYTSPMAAILCADVDESMYAQMACGLCQRRDVARVGAVFAAGLLRAILFLRQHWEQLAADIEAGELSPSRVSDPAVREAVAGVLRAPDPELALAIRTECGGGGGDWAGIVARVWPNARCVDTIVTGSMAQYVPTLDFYSGGLPIASTKYVSSECPVGLNLRPTCDAVPSEASYTVMPNMAYFEFLPCTADDGSTRTASELVELAGVEAGREYELVVTTYGGLSRCRVGDVLRVTGFHNAAPQLRFARRSNVLLSVDADKTGEAELQRAVERAAALLRPHGAAVLDYTSRTCAASIPGHYVVYWELLLLATTKTMDMDDVLPRCCLEMEEALSYVYRVLRVKDGTIGPLEIRVVRAGTFEDLADYSVAHGGASMGQYKVPRSVTNVPAIVELLDSRVVSRHFSPGLPHWPPAQHLL